MHLHWKERTGEGEDTGEREDAVKRNARVQGCKSEGLFSSADAEMRGEVTGQLTRSKA